MDEFYNEEIEGVEEVKEAQEIEPAIPLLSVKMLNSRVYSTINGDCRLVVTVEGKLRAFLVSVGDITKSFRAVPEIDPEKYIEVKDWTKLINRILPSREAIIRNITLSFLRSGAIDDETLLKNQRALLNSAYPYHYIEK